MPQHRRRSIHPWAPTEARLVGLAGADLDRFFELMEWLMRESNMYLAVVGTPDSAVYDISVVMEDWLQAPFDLPSLPWHLSDQRGQQKLEGVAWAEELVRLQIRVSDLPTGAE